MKKDKTNKKREKLTSVALQQAILKLFKANPGKRYTARHIIEKLQIGNNKDSVQYALDQLEVTGQLKSQKPAPVLGGNQRVSSRKSNPSVTDNPKTTTTIKRGIYEGVVDMTRTGAAYIVVEELDSDIYVPAKYIGGAMHADRVKVNLFFTGGGRRKPEGEVVKVLERAMKNVVGTFYDGKKFGIVTPDRMDVPDIQIDLNNTKNANAGEKVAVEIIEWEASGRFQLRGVVTSVLGMPGTSDIEMKSILINSGFNIEFPEDVLKEAAAIKDDIGKEATHRRDFRNIPTFTIDPIDAKDFDDALSYRVLDNGNVEVGVHIADVTHYVKPDTALDREAYLRSTSVYLVDRVCPMLPERLSNELCSLRPNEDKLTFSAVFEFNESLRIVNRWFGKTIIHSNHRFTYEEAQKVLTEGVGDFADELLKLNQIAYHLRKKRFRDGSINFETDEVKFRLDENGVPIEVYVKVRQDAHTLIEDFMLLANREVATFMAKKEALEIPFVYRIHDLPDLDKLNDFALFAREMGVKINFDSPKNIAKTLNDLTKKAEKDDNLKILMPIAIRCMAKAVYSTKNIGHYGLAFEYYCHFTSPIRRYSDVLAHRILEKNLGATAYRVEKESLEARCQHISKQERKAAEAERESVKYKQVEYIKKHIGETFDGIISGMIDRGVFVEIKSMLTEGLADFSRMPEAFEVEPSRLRARGVRTGKILKMGQPVKVQIVDADLETKRVEMRLVV